MTPRKLPTGPRFAEQLLLDAAVEIQQDPDATEATFMARHLVQCTLPHSDPGDIRQWSRTNGTFTLRIRPNFDPITDKALFPYGSIPRLLLFWIVTEAKQKKSRQLRLGNSLDSFMREVGLNPRTGGGKRSDAKRLREQMTRLFRATISFDDSRIGHDRWVDMQVAPKAELWWTPGRATQDTLWDSWIELGETFYEAVTSSSVPVDLRALKALKRSPLALDLYAWLTYTAYVATKNRTPRIVPWKGLHGQMGAEYAELRQFRANVQLALRKIRIVYPGLKVEITPAAIIIHPSRTAISSNS
jgi:hypothetical protein